MSSLGLLDGGWFLLIEPIIDLCQFIVNGGVWDVFDLSEDYKSSLADLTEVAAVLVI